MIRLTRLVLMLGTITLAGCAGGDKTVSPPPHPSSVVIAGGNSQTGTVYRPLSTPLVVLVINSDGSRAVNVAVEWAVRTGSGTLSDSSVTTNSQGQSSVTWTLGKAAGDQSVAAIVAGLTGSPVNFTATATAPIVIHFDGTRWSTMLQDTSGVAVTLGSIWGSSASDVYAVGACLGGFLMLHYDGGRWSSPPSSWCTHIVSISTYNSIWGSSASDAFVIGNGAFPSPETWIDHYDGQTWSRVYTCYSCNPVVRAGWSRTAKDAFAVGLGGGIWHYDGTQWNFEASGTGAELIDVWGAGTGAGVFAVGELGVIVYYDGTTWRRQTSGTTQTLYAVWGTSPNDVFAVGEGGTILHYDGTAWAAQTSGSTQPLTDVWGTSGSSVFAVGSASTILHYDGSSWTAQSANASIDLGGVWGSSANDVFAVGGPR